MKEIASSLMTAANVIRSGGRQVSHECLALRLTICDKCINFDGKKCSICGCNMHIKAIFSASECPENLWP